MPNVSSTFIQRNYTCLALWKHHVNLLLQNEAKQVYCIHHVNVQETYLRN